MNPVPTFRSQQGISLLETMIAVLVLAIGLLGVAGLQTMNLKNSQSAHQRTMAVMLAGSMAERIRANAVLARTGVFAQAKTCNTINLGGSIQNVERTQWINELKLALGAATSSCGEVSYDGANRIYTIVVSWDDSRALGGLSEMTIRQQVRIL
ncbi:type IV pilus modification protein PilV [Rheinheimera tilapiae]|jgi:type IV pilus assembly protein PilV|uniref:Type IV pilus modification protein PilV n=1 Tax=Rheinheimera tilapiae TaxID=875043 RepID=A0ABV6BDH2_9GAMM